MQRCKISRLQGAFPFRAIIPMPLSSAQCSDHTRSRQRSVRVAWERYTARDTRLERTVAIKVLPAADRPCLMVLLTAHRPASKRLQVLGPAEVLEQMLPVAD